MVHGDDGRSVHDTGGMDNGNHSPDDGGMDHWMVDVGSSHNMLNNWSMDNVTARVGDRVGHNWSHYGVVNHWGSQNNTGSGGSGSNSQKASESDLELICSCFKAHPVFVNGLSSDHRN